MLTPSRTKAILFMSVLQLLFSVDLYGENYAKFIQQYQSGGVVEKRLAIKSLKQFNKKPLLSFFIEASNHHDSFIRRYAFEGISQYQTKEALQVLKKSLSDPSPYVLRNSIPLFSKFHFPEAVNSLLPLLKYEDNQILLKTVDTLAHIGSKDIIFKLAPYLNSPFKDVQSQTFLNIGMVIQKYRNEFKSGLDADFKPDLKLSTLKTVDKLINIFIPSFKKTWAGENSAVRKNALWCIDVIVETFLEQLDTYILFEEEKELLATAENVKNKLISVIPILLKSFERIKEEELRWALLATLTKFKHNDSLPIFIAGFKDDSFLIRAGSIQGLVELNHMDSMQDIIPLLADTATLVRIKAIQAIEWMGSEENAPQLIPLLKDKNIQVKWHAAKALGGLSNKKAVQPLTSLLRFKNDLIRSIAVQSLGKLGFAESIQPLSKAANDKSYLVREQAANALGKLGNREEALSTLIKLLSDKNKYVRRSVLNSLFITIKKSATAKLDKKIRPLIVSALEDEDRHVRTMASKFLKILN